ncbi:MAG: hypothetical protein ACRELE_06685 [Gemmatimonadales bacterium]
MRDLQVGVGDLARRALRLVVRIWLRLARKSAALASILYQKALDVARCHGRIDGQRKAFDDMSWLR